MLQGIVKHAAVSAMTYLALCAAPSCYALDAITLSPRVIEVGKWAEGIAFDGSSLWVSESGQRTIAQLDLGRGTVARRITVGRLPVNMVLASDGAIYTLVQTDKQVWQQYPNTASGKALTGLEGCPNGLTVNGQTLWVLTWPDCSSETGRIIRVDPHTGARASSAMLMKAAQAVISSQGKIWVAHNQGENLSIVDEQSLAIQKTNVQGAFLEALSTSGGNIHVGGTIGNQGIVAAVDPRSFQEVRRQIVDQPIAFMAEDAKSVVAVGNKGKIFIFSPGTLEPERIITLPTQPLDPRAALIVGDTLYISNGQQFGENGAVLILSGWRPAAVAPTAPRPVAPTPAPTPPSSALATAVSSCPYTVLNASPVDLWLYQDPDTIAPKVVGIPPNSGGLVVDRCITNWCHVTFRGATGWIERGIITPSCP